MEFIMGVAVLLVVLGILGIVYAFRYNKMITERIKTEAAEVNIDEHLRRKYDAINRCISIVERKLKIDVKTFEKVKSVKSDTLSNFEMDRLLSKAFDEIKVITEDHKEIRENKDFNALVKEINELEEHLVALRSYYNKYCLEYNKRINKFPDNVIAKTHKFIEKPYYDGKNLNDDIYTDFKL